ncbi:Uncharacterised protein [uncultured Avibacterium sp.]|uniref:Preprotein translocase subunit SecB n=1 Tax=uncultured Avibacterium sp. TaxID=1936169 RepID=A0A486XCR3_9PAST|nr:Uncharacterised protein [uncultured Avibacterium sp.]
MYEKHPIQLVSVSYHKLSIELNQKQQENLTSEIDENSNSFQMRFAHSEYDKEMKSIGVKLNISIGYEYDGVSTPQKISNCDFYLEVTVEGIFLVDESLFPIDKIESWASSNAPLVLYSYAREAAFSLTNRLDKNSAAILPLLSVPTFRIVQPNNK